MSSSSPNWRERSHAHSFEDIAGGSAQVSTPGTSNPNPSQPDSAASSSRSSSPSPRGRTRTLSNRFQKLRVSTQANEADDEAGGVRSERSQWRARSPPSRRPSSHYTHRVSSTHNHANQDAAGCSGAESATWRAQSPMSRRRRYSQEQSGTRRFSSQSPRPERRRTSRSPSNRRATTSQAGSQSPRQQHRGSSASSLPDTPHRWTHRSSSPPVLVHRDAASPAFFATPIARIQSVGNALACQGTCHPHVTPIRSPNHSPHSRGASPTSTRSPRSPSLRVDIDHHMSRAHSHTFTQAELDSGRRSSAKDHTASHSFLTLSQFCASFYHMEATIEAAITERCLLADTPTFPSSHRLCPRKSALTLLRLERNVPQEDGSIQWEDVPGGRRVYISCKVGMANNAYAEADRSHIHSETFIHRDIDLRNLVIWMRMSRSSDQLGSREDNDRLTLYQTYQPCHYSSGHSERRILTNGQSCTLQLLKFLKETLEPNGIKLRVKVPYLYRAHWEVSTVPARYGPAIESARKGLQLLGSHPNVEISAFDDEDWKFVVRLCADDVQEDFNRPPEEAKWFTEDIREDRRRMDAFVKKSLRWILPDTAAGQNVQEPPTPAESADAER